MEKDNSKNISFVVKSGLCTGCGTCVGLCPRSAIRMLLDNKRGIYLPRIYAKLCNDCGICVAVCPGHEVNYAALNGAAFGRQPDAGLLGNYIACYTGHAVDAGVRYNSSSGGMASALLVHALEKGMITGALVTRMNPAKPMETLPFIARTREEILSACGSKYCPVPANIALAEILKAGEGEKLAVAGLPCHIHGLRKAEMVNKKLKERMALRLGLFCSNTNSFKMTEYILSKQGIKPHQVEKLDYRGSGWPGSMSIMCTDGRFVKIPYEEYIKYHQFGFFTPRRCTLCCDLTSEMADISAGDAWLEKDKEKGNDGISLVIVRSSTGRQLLASAVQENAVSISDYSPSLALRSAGNKRTNLAARIRLNRLVRKPVPEYFGKMPRPSPLAYPYYLVVYFNLWVSSKVFLRNLVDVLLSCELSLMRIIKKYIRRPD